MMSSGNTSDSDSVRMISEILKRANQLIQKGELARAQGELVQANRAAKERFKKKIASSSKNIEIPRTQIPHAPLPLKPMEALATVISTPKEIVNTPPTPTTHISKVPSTSPPTQRQEEINDRSIEFQYYRDALAKAWCDGALTKDEERHLQELRTVLEITDTEHSQLEQEIKLLCYKDAVARHLSCNMTASPGAKSLEELQEAFHISQEEHLQIHSEFKRADQGKQREKILVIDDDNQVLDMLARSMKEDGFDVTAVTTSDEAYALVQERTPDLIMCDINLQTSTMNGFTFFKKMIGLEHLKNVPFIFITGLTDEKLESTGKELGADDFLQKPISKHTLLSTLHNRLKRFRDLKGFSDVQTPAFC